MRKTKVTVVFFVKVSRKWWQNPTAREFAVYGVLFRKQREIIETIKHNGRKCGHWKIPNLFCVSCHLPLSWSRKWFDVLLLLSLSASNEKYLCPSHILLLLYCVLSILQQERDLFPTLLKGEYFTQGRLRSLGFPFVFPRQWKENVWHVSNCASLIWRTISYHHALKIAFHKWFIHFWHG